MPQPHIICCVAWRWLEQSNYRGLHVGAQIVEPPLCLRCLDFRCSRDCPPRTLQDICLHGGGEEANDVRLSLESRRLRTLNTSPIYTWSRGHDGDPSRTAVAVLECRFQCFQIYGIAGRSALQSAVTRIRSCCLLAHS